jgi:hypothetical protein
MRYTKTLKNMKKETKTTLYKKLSSYKKLLKIYLFAKHIFDNELQFSTKLEITETLYQTSVGLCLAMSYLFEDFHVADFEEKFPELYAQKPIRNYSYMYWFCPGDLSSRICCIQKAIELTQFKIDNYGV